MLMTLLLAGAVGLVIWLSVRSMNREKAARDRKEAILARVKGRHGIEDVFVSTEDGSYVGLSNDGTTLAVGHGNEDRVAPVSDIVAVEGIRDDVVLVRAARSGGQDLFPPTSRSPADLPERIRRLGLRVALEGEDDGRTILFFDGGKHGVDPINANFRKQAVETEAWFRKLTNAMRLAS